MEKCREYFNCSNETCVMHDRKDDRSCWEIEGTLCSNHGIRMIRKCLDGKKEEACARANCIYYRTMKIYYMGDKG